MKIKEIQEDVLIFDNEAKITSYHESDCCEHHWADFSVVRGYNINTATGKQINIYDVDFSENVQEIIQLVEEIGFNLVALDGSKYFVPCYGSNNGYYSTDLELRISGNSFAFTIDITNCQVITD